MLRLARMLRNALTGVSLLLFAATVALWVRGYFASDIIGLRVGGMAGSVSTAPNSLEFAIV